MCHLALLLDNNVAGGVVWSFGLHRYAWMGIEDEGAMLVRLDVCDVEVRRIS